jgi:hypothetical protein
MVPPSARRTVSSTVSSITDLTKATFSFSGKALWVISTSAFLLGVPFALAYAEEEQYIQMEREQGMIKGANEVCVLCFLLVSFSWFLSNCNIYFESRFLLSLAQLTPCTLPRVFASRQYSKFFFPSTLSSHVIFALFTGFPVFEVLY